MSRVGLLASGGTIISAADAVSGSLRPTLSIADVVHEAGLDGEHALVCVEEHTRAYSCDLTPEAMLGIARRSAQLLDDHELDGLVVTHGSDTLEETAFLCDVLLDDPRPVVFTAAMKPAGAWGSDGAANLRTAVRVAGAPEARGLGVVVTVGADVHAARWVRKQDSFRLGAFASPGRPSLGAVTPSGVELWGCPPPRVRVLRPVSLSAPVAALPAYGDTPPELLRAVVAATGARGLVVEGAGMGNVPALLVPAVAELIGDGVVVAVTTRTSTGGTHAVYDSHGGAAALQAAGAVLAGALPTAKTRLLLMAILATTPAPREAAERLRRAV